MGCGGAFAPPALAAVRRLVSLLLVLLPGSLAVAAVPVAERDKQAASKLSALQQRLSALEHENRLLASSGSLGSEASAFAEAPSASAPASAADDHDDGGLGEDSAPALLRHARSAHIHSGSHRARRAAVSAAELLESGEAVARHFSREEALRQESDSDAEYATGAPADNASELFVTPEPDKPRELRVWAYAQKKGEELCLTHSTIDHFLVLTNCSNLPRQLFYFDEMGNLRGVNTTRCLSHARTYQGAPRRRRRADKVYMDRCNGEQYQKWYISDNGLGKSLRHRDNVSLCVGMVDPTKGARMVPCDNASESQQMLRAPVRDCEWGKWSRWTPCTLSCGNGQQSRQRSVELLQEAFGGCPGNATETQSCNGFKCPIDCVWSPWTPWTTCSTTCAEGFMARRRAYLTPPQYGGTCEGFNYEQRICRSETHRECPVDCAWSLWEEWTPCSTTCGGGVKSRGRLIAQHAMFGGKPCPTVGSYVETGSDTYTDGGAVKSSGTVSGWSTCSGAALSGLGFVNLSSAITGRFVGFECSDTASQCRVHCKGSECIGKARCSPTDPKHVVIGSRVDAVPGKMSELSKCPDKGLPIGLAKLDFDNKEAGRLSDFICDKSGCKVKCMATMCQFAALCLKDYVVTPGAPSKALADKPGHFSKCPTGTQPAGVGQVTMLDNSDKAKLVGWECTKEGCRAFCSGTDCIVKTRCVKAEVVEGIYQEKVCARNHCPVNCEMDAWQPWAKCDKTCGGGMQMRERAVLQRALHGGVPCSSLGGTEERKKCNDFQCPVDCIMAEWGFWGSCTVTCGGGAKYRVRKAARTPKYLGEVCPLSLRQEEKCAMAACPVDCMLSAWAMWTSCSKSCGYGGERLRDQTVLRESDYGGVACPEMLTQIDKSCADMPCPHDCVEGDWTWWSECSKTCGIGTKKRVRSPTVPALYGGKACDKEQTESIKCSVLQWCEDEVTSLLESPAKVGDDDRGDEAAPAFAATGAAEEEAAAAEAESTSGASARRERRRRRHDS